MPEPYKRIRGTRARGSLFPALRSFNYVAGIVHLTFAVAVACVGFSGDAPYTLTLQYVRADTQKLLDAAPYLKSPVCANVTYTNVFDWFDCLRENTNLTESRSEFENAYSNTVKEKWFEIDVWWYLMSFATTTACFHFVLYSLDGVYEGWLDNRIQPLRWWEYASTYTSMTICLFALNGQTNVYLYALLIVSSIAQMLIGYAIEYTNRAPVDPVELQRWKAQGCCDIYTCARVDRPTTGKRNCCTRVYFMERDWPKLILHWGLYETAFLIMASHFFILWDSFIDAFEPYFEYESEDLWKQLYGFILYLNVFILCAYVVFPIIHLSTYCVRTKRCYLIGEFAYVCASMTAKVGLISVVFAGISARP